MLPVAGSSKPSNAAEHRLFGGKNIEEKATFLAPNVCPPLKSFL
jgi:hypothetical protein